MPAASLIVDDDAPAAPPRRAEDLQVTLVILLLSAIVLGFNSIGLGAGFTNSAQSIAANRSTFYLACFAGMILPLIYSPHWRIAGLYPIIATAVYCAGITSLIFGSNFLFILTLQFFALGYLIALSARNSVANGCHNAEIRASPRFLVDGMVAIAAMIVLVCAVCLQVAGVIYLGSELLEEPFISFNMLQYCLLGLLHCLFAWLRLFRFTYELFFESLIRIGYRFRWQGDGVAAFPIHGPVIVIANHACWWDPLFIAAELPRPMTAMMTASFYDLWFLRPIMKHAFGTIRVPETASRREAPEILEAVAALNNGHCVVLFPEGYLRRKEEMPLRRFGRGIYEILKLRPETPVVPLWIEGAWGSWCSWKDGPPVKGKPVDFRRKIDIGVGVPVTVPPALLENHLATRVFLMNAVSAARTQLGLEPLTEFPMPRLDEATESAAEKDSA